MSKNDRRMLKSAFVGYKHLNHKTIAMLQSFNLQVISCNNHYKITRSDGLGGSISIPATPSDNRSGINAAMLIIRFIER